MTAYSNDSEFEQIRQELLSAILDAVEPAGTALALPTQASVDYSRTDSPQPNGARSPQEAAEAHNASDGVTEA